MGVPPNASDNSTSDLWLRDIRVYPRMLQGREIDAISRNPRLEECLDLDKYSDNAEWVSEFGQTCADLAEMITGGGESSAPAACRAPEFKRNCPVSCMHELAPMCFDGSPPVPKPNRSFPLGARLMMMMLPPVCPRGGKTPNPCAHPRRTRAGDFWQRCTWTRQWRLRNGGPMPLRTLNSRSLQRLVTGLAARKMCCGSHFSRASESWSKL
mmetsp:Transcript_16757/g.39824  ORF Transcript_16757/g.39824 Transcript_16757/m.39824 type:complete len:211 (+) Transcript_16757:1913-2545(+)